MKLTKQVITSLFWTLPLISFAQHRIGYRYDAAGNRVEKTILFRIGEVERNVLDKYGATDRMYSDLLKGHEIEISPNPVSGILRILIKELSDKDTCHLELFTMKGELVERIEIKNNNTEVDMQALVPSIYLLRIYLNKTSTTWKIIKE